MGDKAQLVEWPRYEFYIKVPEGALPPGVTARVHIRAIFGSQFNSKNSRQLISPLFLVSSSEEFHKDVDVNIKHCADIENVKQLSSFRFKTFSQKPPYQE